MRTPIIIPVFLLSLFLGVPAYSADFNKGLDAYKNKDFKTAFRELKPFAIKGNKTAQFILGFMYKNGEGVSKNTQKALEWYELSAAQGFADANYNLGQIYRKGDGVKKNMKKAFEFYKVGAENGSVKAQSNLGAMYQNGVGVKQDQVKALHWFKVSAQKGHKYSQGNLGIMYYHGQGVKQSFLYAYMWGNIASSNGFEYGKMIMIESQKRLSLSKLAEAKKLANECVESNYTICKTLNN